MWFSVLPQYELDTGVHLEQNDIGFITVAICGGFSPFIAQISQIIIEIHSYELWSSMNNHGAP